MRKDKVVVVIPAYNSERTIKNVYSSIPKNLIDEVVINDDGSRDKTKLVLKKMGLKFSTHKKNMGYGANQKTLYTDALGKGAKYIIMLHPDGQYDPVDLPKFVKVLKAGKADFVMGSRFLSNMHETPLYKRLPLRLIAFVFNIVLGTNLSEVNSGYRGYTSDLLRKVPFMKNGNGYIFDPQLLIQSVYFGFKISEVPVSKVYNKEAISPNLSKSLEHGLENIKLLFEYMFQKLKIKEISFLTSDN